MDLASFEVAADGVLTVRRPGRPDWSLPADAVNELRRALARPTPLRPEWVILVGDREGGLHAELYQDGSVVIDGTRVDSVYDPITLEHVQLYALRRRLGILGRETGEPDVAVEASRLETWGWRDFREQVIRLRAQAAWQPARGEPARFEHL